MSSIDTLNSHIGLCEDAAEATHVRTQHIFFLKLNMVSPYKSLQILSNYMTHLKNTDLHLGKSEFYNKTLSFKIHIKFCLPSRGDRTPGGVFENQG